MLWTKAKYVFDSGSDAPETSQRLRPTKEAILILGQSFRKMSAILGDKWTVQLLCTIHMYSCLLSCQLFALGGSTAAGQT